MGVNEQYIIPIFVGGTLLLTLFVFFIIYYILVQKHKQNQHQLEKQKMLFDSQKKILRARIEEQENTMNQISIELHDNLATQLALTQVNMYMVEEQASNEKQALLIAKTNNLLNTVIDDLHNLSHSLNSNFVKHIGLVEVMKKELETLTSNKHIYFSLTVNGSYASFGSEKELLIYRIAQAILHNAIKHAQASEISIALNYLVSSFSMVIADNGIGFDKNIIDDMTGLGFFNMSERAKYLNGKLDIKTAPKHGTKITLTIIYGNKEAL
jgi:two-component system NarL family sensor kinase